MTIFLLSFVVILFFVVVFYISKALDFSRIVKEGLHNDYVATTKINAFLMMLFYIVGMIVLVMTTYHLLPRLLPEANSVHGVEMDKMYDYTVLLTTVVFILTQTILYVFVYFYRYDKNRTAFYFPHDNRLEMAWTIIPSVVLVILVFMGIKVWKDTFDFAQLDGKDVLVFEVTGKQFQWLVRYPGKDGELGKREISYESIDSFKARYKMPNELGIVWTDKASKDDIINPNAIYLVKDKPVLVKLGALDVIHSFYLPHFRVKMDCVPGMSTQFMFTPKHTTEEYKKMLKTRRFWRDIDPKTGEERWKGFKFELACAELCGKAHWGMQKEVVVVSQEEYDKWLNEQEPFYTKAKIDKLLSQK